MASPTESSASSDAEIIAESSVNIMVHHFQTMLSFLEDLEGE